eukprot:7874844-Pyramimonas_sp.AAC.1
MRSHASQALRYDVKATVLRTQFAFSYSAGASLDRVGLARPRASGSRCSDRWRGYSRSPTIDHDYARHLAVPCLPPKAQMSWRS